MEEHDYGVQQKSDDSRQDDKGYHRAADVEYKDANQNTGDSYGALGGLTPFRRILICPAGLHPSLPVGYIEKIGKPAHQTRWFADSLIG
jgi:hypothetical protein